MIDEFYAARNMILQRGIDKMPESARAEINKQLELGADLILISSFTEVVAMLVVNGESIELFRHSPPVESLN